MRLQDLYRSMSIDERDVLAQRAGTTAPYLYQLATRWQGKRPSLKLVMQLSGADPRLTVDDLVREFDETPAPKVV